MRFAGAFAEFSCLTQAPESVYEMAEVEGNLNLLLLKRAANDLSAELNLLSFVSGLPENPTNQRFFPSTERGFNGFCENIAARRFIGDAASEEFRFRFKIIKPVFSLLPDNKAREDAYRDCYRELSIVQAYRKFTSTLAKEIVERYLKEGEGLSSCREVSDNPILNLRSEIHKEQFLDENECSNSLSTMVNAEVLSIQIMREKLVDLGEPFKTIAYALGYYVIDDESTFSDESKSQAISCIREGLENHARETASLLMN